MNQAEHERTGKELHQMQEYVTALSVQLHNTYGGTTKAAKLSRRLDKVIQDLRSELENCMFVDCPDLEASKVICSYYPGNTQKD